LSEHILFVDTEASGLPVDWHLPYSAEGNWPSAVQVSWIVYTRDGREVKREDHYVLNSDFIITPAAMAIHGINPGMLAVKGEKRQHVMQLLAADLEQYEPLVVGHFLQLDYHILGADMYRAGIDNRLVDLPVFCTMLATTQFLWNPMPRHLLLGDLYSYLFYKPLQDQHNAMCDVEATAECFFELKQRGEISEALIAQQQKDAGIKELKPRSRKLFAMLLPLIIVLALILLSRQL
jgi:DNA polymerase III subunit epsilon